MFRLPIRLALIFCITAFSLAAYAQQTVPSPPAAQTAPALAAEAPQANAPQTSTPPGEALPDDPGTTANVQPPLEPEGPTAVLDTSMGRMVCRLYSKEAPLAAANFVGLAIGKKDWTDPATHQKESGKPFYDGTTFHRVIPGFMIQGGDPTATGSGDAGYFIPDEITPKLIFDVAGRLAMANAGPNTNGTQFFITVSPQPSLDQHYSIFGQCDPGSVLVAESITQVPRNDRDKPIEPVYLNKVTIVETGQPLPALPAASQPGPAAATPQP